MPEKKLFVCLLFGFLSVFFMGNGALAAESKLLASISPDGRSPEENLRFTVPPELANKEIGLEINNMDVTALLEKEGKRIVYPPFKPLEVGSHQVKLFLIKEDGSTETLGKWQIKINQPAPAQTATDQKKEPDTQTTDAVRSKPAATVIFSGDNSLDLKHRFAKRGLTMPDDRNSASGGGNANIKVETDNLRFLSRGGYVLQSDTNKRLTNRALDLTEYRSSLLYQSEKAALGLNLGHFSPSFDGLIMSGFERRGAGAWVSSREKMIEGHFFSLAETSLAGAADTLGHANNSGFVRGGGLIFRPLQTNSSDVTVSALFFNGEEGNQSTGVGSLDTNRGDGKGYGLILDSYWFNKRLRLQGDLARTDYDSDGNGVLPRTRSDAFASHLSYALVNNEKVNNSNMNLLVGARWRRVDTNFASLANPGLAADQDYQGVYGNLVWGGLNLNLEYFEQENNVDDISILPTDRARTVNLLGSYSFSIDRKNPGDRAWLGNPYLSFGLSRAEAERVQTPSGYLGSGTDNLTETYYLNLGSSYRFFNWELGYYGSRFNDDTNTINDQQNNLYSIRFGWQPNERIQLSVGGQYGTADDRTAGTRSESYTGNFSAQAILIPNKLTALLNYNMNLQAGFGDLPDSHQIDGEAVWTVAPPRKNRAGIAFALRGNLERIDGNGNSALDRTSYAAFVILRLTASVGN